MSRNRRQTRPRARSPHWLTLAAAGAAGYFLGSGPVLAAACWLRDATGWDVFYAVEWMYPVRLMPGAAAGEAWLSYVRWWMELLGTHLPG